MTTTIRNQWLTLFLLSGFSAPAFAAGQGNNSTAIVLIAACIVCTIILIANYFGYKRRLLPRFMILGSSMLLLTVTMATVSIFDLSNVTHKTEELNQNQLPMLTSLTSLSSKIINEQLIFSQAQASKIQSLGKTSPSKLQELRDSHESINSTLSNLLNSVTTAKSKTPNSDYKIQKQAIITEIRNTQSNFERYQKQVTAALTNTNIISPLALKQLTIQREGLSKNYDSLIKISSSNTQNTLTEILSIESQFSLHITALLIISVLFMVFAPYLVIRGVLRHINRAAKQAKAMANGNLTTIIKTNSRCEVSDLIRSLNNAQEKICDIIENTIHSSDIVKSAAQEVSTSASSLSQRVESQAASQERTASSIEEINSTLQASAQNTVHASELVSKTNERACNGGAQIKEAIDAMQAITDASEKIEQIIGVIDDIAFQTNLLALNASVEAARAGEQGKGFAVVAAEVRNLAQRSADAAGEIKVLIEANVTRVRNGSELVNQSGEILVKIVSEVDEVSNLISEMACAAQEQSKGVEEINHAMTEIDQIMQQNTGLVENLAKSSVSMVSEASLTRNNMNFFSTSHSAIARPINDAPKVKKSRSAEAFTRHGKPSTEAVNTRPNFQENPESWGKF